MSNVGPGRKAPKKKQAAKGNEKWIGITAIIVSFLTLSVLFYQTRLMHEQQKMSALPYLTLLNYGNGSPYYKMVLTNDGIGPAFIDSVFVITPRDTFDMDLPRFLAEYYEEYSNINGLLHSNIYGGKVLPAQQQLAILELTGDTLAPAQIKKLFKRLEKDQVKIGLIYRSIYNDRWILYYGQTRPEPIEN